jgi:type I restriction enzyme S subunit
LGEEQIAISGDAYIFKHNQNAKYIAYFFQTESFQKQKKPYVTGTKVMRVSGENMAKIKIPIPTLALQEKIVSILDRFESLVNDLTAGLPAEIDARRQQYEYYRNQLLTFKRLA